MTLAYVLDEHLRGPLWRAIQRHNARNVSVINAVRVGDQHCPALASGDSEILRWAEQVGRILVTLDEKTIPGHLTDHLRNGHHSPGVFMVRPDSHIPEVVDFLALATLASAPQEWADRIAYVP
jgi:hypothetical protein